MLLGTILTSGVLRDRRRETPVLCVLRTFFFILTDQKEYLQRMKFWENPLCKLFFFVTVYFTVKTTRSVQVSATDDQGRNTGNSIFINFFFNLP